MPKVVYLLSVFKGSSLPAIAIVPFLALSAQHSRTRDPSMLSVLQGHYAAGLCCLCSTADTSGPSTVFVAHFLRDVLMSMFCSSGILLI